MRRWAAVVVGFGLVVAACSSDSASETSPTTTAEALSTTTTPTPTPPTTSTSTSTSTSTTSAPATTTSLVVPPAECAIDLPDSDLDEVTDVELAAFSVGAGSSQLWTIDLGNRSVQMDTLGDRVYLATFDGHAASFDVDPCGLDWVSTIPTGVSGLVATNQGLFVTTPTALSLVELIEGTVTSFPLEDATHALAAGPDVLAVSNGDSVLLYDYVTQQASALNVGTLVEDVASAGDAGLALAYGITIELRTWLGAPVWARDVPDPVAAVTAADGLLVAELNTGGIVVLETQTGDVLWEKSFSTGSDVAIGPIDHDELHVLETELGVAASHHHLNPGDGSTVFVNQSAALQTFAEYDDGLLLIVDEGIVTGRGMLEQDLWTITTGADGLGRFTEVDVTSGLVIALSYSAERF